MLPHLAANPETARACRDHVAGVGDMRAESRLVRLQDVTADNLSILFGHVGVRAGPEPVRERFFARCVWIEYVGVASRDDIVEDIPDRVAICITGLFEW